MDPIARRINHVSRHGVAAAALVLLVGCQNMPTSPFSAGTTTNPVGGEVVTTCGGRASIAVTRFDNKAPKLRSGYSKSIGEGIADQLTTALFSSKCFRVADRQNVKAIFEELGYQGSGAVDPSTASKIGKQVGADLLVTAAITDFQESVSGSRSRTQSSGNKLRDALVTYLNSDTAYMAVDIRVTDVQTGEIVSASAVEGRARDVAGGFAGALFGGDGSGIGGALSGWDTEPRGKALRAVINNAVVALTKDIPPVYFKYNRIGRDASIQASLPSGEAQLARKVQQVLKALGLYNGAIDGKLGPKSSEALSQFQADFDLEVTGKLNSETVKMVNELAN